MKKIFYILCFIELFFYMGIIANADTIQAYVSGSGVFIRSKATTDSEKLTKLDYGANLTLPNTDKISGTGCNDGWYQVNYDSISGYMCSTYVTITKTVVVVEDNTPPSNEYETYLKSIGFPSSYWGGLSLLHEAHPNWVFKANILNVEWDAALNAQSVDGNSLTDGNVGFYDTGAESYDWLTDTFKPKELTTRFNASDKAISYYMDPRNWLTERYIFQFEDLTYHSSYQTLEVVQEIFTTSSNPNGVLKSHSQEFVNAANQVIDGVSTSISPVHLATRSRQEVGMSNDRTQILGTSPSTYRGFAVKGYYNFFNIGAYSDKYTTNPVARGLAYAAGPDCTVCSFSSTYGRPWNTAQKAISGGAQFIINKYLLKGQKTVYYQRYNAISSNPFSNQYMTSIEAPTSESSTTYNAYDDTSKLNEAIVFEIPVYINMPTLPSPKPNNGNPNNHLKSLSVNNTLINNFSHDTYNYNIVVANGTTNVNISGEVINSNAKISGDGTIDISKNKEVSITVTAQNGDIQIYKLTFSYSDEVVMKPSEIINNAPLKSDGTIIYNLGIGTTTKDLNDVFTKISNNITITVKDASGNNKTNDNIVTGDVISITSGGETKEYPMSIQGDPSGDGKVTIMDLLKIQKHILNASPLSSVYLKSADVNLDGNVTILDLLRVQKYILGVITKF